MPDISVYVLKPFPFSWNGVKEEYAEAGRTLSIPWRLFDGLNREGYVRRAEIGDGHFALRPADGSGEVDQDVDRIVLPTIAVAEEIHEETLLAKEAAANLAAATHAPQPPVKTADLSEDEEQAITDGSWKSLKYFAKRSIAAKLSDQAIGNAADADAAIEAYIASKG